VISFEDVRWREMTGGYGTPFDPRPLLKRIETDSDTTEAWKQLWDELHHQGDVGDASFAAVPFLVESYRKRGGNGWSTYAIVAIIELARGEGTNPDVPQWMAEDYFQAIRKLAEIGAEEVLRAKAREDVRAILSVVAIQKGLRAHAKFLANYSEVELLEIESRV